MNPGKHLYEVVFAAGDHGREGFSISLTPEEVSELKERFEAGQARGTVRDWVIIDLLEEGVSYEQLVAMLERGGPVKGKFSPPDHSKELYRVEVTFKPKFFGLRKAVDLNLDVFMDPDQVEYLESVLSEDDRISDWDVIDFGENVSKKEFSEIIDERVGAKGY